MKFLKTLFIILVFLFMNSMQGQESTFIPYPDFSITIDPQIPKVCQGEPTKIMCKEKYEEYEWEGVGFDFQASGNIVSLTQVGQYTLTVKGEINGTSYFKILNFYTESNDSDLDGICDPDDCSPDNPFTATGRPCDDNNPCTANDVFDQNCHCKGTAVKDCEYNNTGQSASLDLQLKKELASAYSKILSTNLDPKKNLDSLFTALCVIPNARQLLDEKLKASILTLPHTSIATFFDDILISKNSPGYLGHELSSISNHWVQSWSALTSTPTLFRTSTSTLQAVSKYATDFNKSPQVIREEIDNTRKGYSWWFDYELGRKYWKPFLSEYDDIRAFAREILEFNKKTEGQGKILSGTPSSAINTALYYDDVLEQGASIFKTIIKNHMFYDGNKRTAVSAIISFMNHAGIPINKSEKKIFKLAKKVATGEIEEVSDIANKLIKK